jgi:hypothetical protein
MSGVTLNRRNGGANQKTKSENLKKQSAKWRAAK